MVSLFEIDPRRQTLHELGADVRKSHRETGCSPLYMAATRDDGDALVRQLHALGADIDAPNHHGATPTFVAAQNGREVSVSRLA